MNAYEQPACSRCGEPIPSGTKVCTQCGESSSARNDPASTGEADATNDDAAMTTSHQKSANWIWWFAAAALVIAFGHKANEDRLAQEFRLRRDSIEAAKNALAAEQARSDLQRCTESGARAAVLRANYAALVGMGVSNPRIVLRNTRMSAGTCSADYLMDFGGGIPVEDVVSWTP